MKSSLHAEEGESKGSCVTDNECSREIVNEHDTEYSDKFEQELVLEETETGDRMEIESSITKLPDPRLSKATKTKMPLQLDTSNLKTSKHKTLYSDPGPRTSASINVASAGIEMSNPTVSSTVHTKLRPVRGTGLSVTKSILAEQADELSIWTEQNRKKRRENSQKL